MENKTLSELREIAKEKEVPTCAIELNDGQLIIGKTSPLLRCSSAALLNALKYLANVEHDVELISPDMLKAILTLKNDYLNISNPLLEVNEVLLTLTIAAKNDNVAKKCIDVLPLLKGTEIHSTVVLSKNDTKILRDLQMNLTCDPKTSL